MSKSDMKVQKLEAENKKLRDKLSRVKVLIDQVLRKDDHPEEGKDIR